MGRHWSLFSQPSVRHQSTRSDHGYGADASRGVPVYAPAFADTVPTRGGTARLSWFEWLCNKPTTNRKLTAHSQSGQIVQQFTSMQRFESLQLIIYSILVRHDILPLVVRLASQQVHSKLKEWSMGLTENCLCRNASLGAESMDQSNSSIKIAVRYDKIIKINCALKTWRVASQLSM